ncbi:MAG: benzoate/H(+) symporter BenE family transporter [Chloroflexota bacterium]
MLKSYRISHLIAGFVAVLIGYTGSVAIVFQAAQAAGATPEQINSWLLVLGLGVGICCIGLSLWYREPVLAAWSTPGAALLVSNLAGFTMPEAIGAFLLTGLLIFVTGISGLFDRFARLVPNALTSALLAGILLRFGLDAFVQLESEPLLVGSMFVAYFIALRLFSRYAVPLTLLVGGAVAAALGLFDTQSIELGFAQPVWTTPRFTWSAVVGITLPLYFITMASQNVPGIAVLRSSGYQTPVSPLIAWTGLVTTAVSPFGGFAINLAAITAAICAGEEADKNPKTRYLAAVSAGIFYLLAALFGATIATLLTASPPALVLAIAGIALLSTIMNSLAASVEETSERTAVGVTFLVAASGISFVGIGAAFWALVAGLVIWRIFK